MRALPLILLLTACSADNPLNQQAKAEKKARKQAAKDAVGVNAGFRPTAPAPLATISVDPVAARAPATILPAATQQYRYIGKWAPTAALCSGEGWRLRTRDLKTVTETRCAYPTVAAVRLGYELQGTCQPKSGRKISETIHLDFDDARKTMHVSSPTLGATDLIYCGD